MGLLLIVLGLVFWYFVSSVLGIICIIVGLILLFAPGNGLYGYSYWRGRRGPP